MRRNFLAVFVLGAAACVEVPDTIHAQFAAPGATDRSNFRPGNHGSAPPAFEAPTPKAMGPAAAPFAPDAGVSPQLQPQATDAVDGGVS